MQTIKPKTRVALKWAVLLLIVLFVALIPVNAEFTPKIKAFFVITVACIGMFALNLFPTPMIPSLLMMFLYSFISDMTTIMSGFAYDSAWVVVCCFILLYIMKRTPLLKRFSYRLIMLTGASYAGICAAIYLCGMAFSLLGDSSCCALIGLAYGIILSLNITDKRAAAGIMFCAYFGITDACRFILDPASMPFFYSLASMADPSLPTGISHLQLLWYDLVYVPYYFLLLVLIIKVFKPKQNILPGGKEYFRAELEQLGPMTRDEKKLTAVILLLLVYLFTTQIHGLSMAFGFVIAVFVLYLPGINVGIAEDVKNVNFSYPIFIVACIGTGNVATQLNVGGMLVEKLMPLMNVDNCLLFFLTVFVVMFVLNYVMTPSAIYACLMLPLASIAVELPYMHNIFPLISVMLSGVQAVFLPYETNNTLILYSYGAMDMKEFVRGFAVKVSLSFVWLFIAYGWWHVIGLIG